MPASQSGPNSLWSQGTVAHQSPPSIEFFQTGILNRSPFPTPGALPDPGSSGAHKYILIFICFKPEENINMITMHQSSSVQSLSRGATLYDAT